LKTAVLIGDVGSAPLMFDVIAEIMIEDVVVAEFVVMVEFEEVGFTDEDPDPEAD
jgi:hypothetical protein